MNKTKELVKNTVILGIGRLFSQVATFFVLPIYAFFLSPEDFGFADLIVTYSAIFVPTLLMQLDRGAFRLIIDSNGNQKTISRVISSALFTALQSIVVAMGVYMVAGAFISLSYFWLIPVLIFTNILSNFFMQVARGLGRNGVYTIASALGGGALLGGVAIALILLRMKANGVLIAISMSYAVSAAYIFIKLKLIKYISFKNVDRATRKELLRYSVPLIPSNIAWWTISFADRTIITAFMGIASTGIYALAFRYSAIFMAMYAIFDMAWTESASRHIKSRDRDAFFSATYNRILKIFGSLGLLFISIIPFVFGLLVSADFAEAYMYMPIMITAALMNSIVAGYSVIYIATKNTKKVMTTSIAAAVLSIGLNMTLIPMLGLYAAAISSLVAFGSMAILRYYDVQKYVRFKYKRSLIALFVSAYVATIAMYYANNIIIHIISICLVVVLMSIINRGEIVKLIKHLQKSTKD